MVAASSSLRDKSYPDTLTQTGSPKGAVKLKRTAVPGRKPISRSLAESVSSEKPEITPVSPGFMLATFLFNSTSYLD
jgi:hypothetical protein